MMDPSVGVANCAPGRGADRVAYRCADYGTNSCDESGAAGCLDIGAGCGFRRCAGRRAVHGAGWCAGGGADRCAGRGAYGSADRVDGSGPDRRADRLAVRVTDSGTGSSSDRSACRGTDPLLATEEPFAREVEKEEDQGEDEKAEEGSEALGAGRGGAAPAGHGAHRVPGWAAPQRVLWEQGQHPCRCAGYGKGKGAGPGRASTKARPARRRRPH